MKPISIKSFFAKKKERKKKRLQKRKLLGSGPTKTQLTKKADQIYSLYIRLRDKKKMCGICNIRPVQVAYHLIPRNHFIVRWDEENGIGACIGCNYGEKNNRLIYREKHIALFGDRYNILEEKAKQPARFSRLDIIQIIANLEAKLSQCRN